MKKIIAFLFIINCFNCFSQTDAEQIMRNPSTALAEAQKAFRIGDYKKAVKFFGIFQSLTGEKDTSGLSTKAIECYELIEKAKHFEEAGNINGANDIYKQIVVINPEDKYVTLKISDKRSEELSTNVNNIENGHEWVDLGLSVKWATCNIGASSNNMSGTHFAWSEIVYKGKYNWSNLKYVKKIKSRSVVQFSKYVTTRRYGKVDQKSSLDLSDDAAWANWGGEWRIPTFLEMKELIDNCSWSWTTQNGEYGYQVTSKINGNNIFLPAAGCIYNSNVKDNGEVGFYWSSSLSGDDSSKANGLYFNADSIVPCSGSRSYGFSVRPVCQ